MTCSSSCDADVAVDVIAFVFRTYLAEQSIDQLAGTLKKGGIKDLLLFFPPNKQEDKVLDEFFRKQGLAQVADWWTKKQYAILKEEVVRAIREHLEHSDSNPDVGRDYFEIQSCFSGIDHEFFFLSVLDRVCDSDEAGRTPFAGGRTHPVHLDGSDKFRRVECTSRSA